MKITFTPLFAMLLISAAWTACSDKKKAGPQAQQAPEIAANWDDINNKIIQPKCATCHQGKDAPHGIVLTDYTAVVSGGHHGEALVVAGNPEESSLYKVVLNGEMPPARASKPLHKNEILAIKEWIKKGAKKSESDANDEEDGEGEDEDGDHDHDDDDDHDHDHDHDDNGDGDSNTDGDDDDHGGHDHDGQDH